MSSIPAAFTPAPQDHTQHDKLIEAMVAQTEVYVGQPCSFPFSPPTQTPDWSMYPIYDINPDFYSLLAQCEQLQLRLEGDTLSFASRAGPFTLDVCDNVREKLTVLLDLSESTLKLKIQALQILLGLSVAVFEHFSISRERDCVQGRLPINILNMLNDDVTTLPATAAPVEAYAQIARQWADLEKAIADETLQVLSMKLQVARLSLYKSAGQYLAKQAGLILNKHLVDEEWVVRGDVHPGRAVLESCLSEPFLGRWPPGAKTRLAMDELSGAANDE